MRNLMLLLVLVFSALTCFACGAAPEPEHVGETAEALTQFVYENVAPGTTCPSSPRSCALYESAGPNPPPTPAYIKTTVTGGAASLNGRYSTLTHVTSINLPDATYDSLWSALNGLGSSNYLRIHTSYDDTACSPSTHLCPIDPANTYYTVESF